MACIRCRFSSPNQTGIWFLITSVRIEPVVAFHENHFAPIQNPAKTARRPKIILLIR